MGLVLVHFQKYWLLRNLQRQYFVGPLKFSHSFHKFCFSNSILYSRCKTPCDGKIPCFRTCDEDPKLSLDNWINSSLSSFLQESMFETHLTKAGAIERQCSKSDKYHRRVLNPQNRCRHSMLLGQ